MQYPRSENFLMKDFWHFLADKEFRAVASWIAPELVLLHPAIE